MAFRLTTLFYLTALTASATATFEMWGLVATVAVPLVWWGCAALRSAGCEEIAGLGALLLVPLVNVMFLLARSSWQLYPFGNVEGEYRVLSFCLFTMLAVAPTAPALWRHIGPRSIGERGGSPSEAGGE